MADKFKVGDKVRVSKDAQGIFVYGLNPLWFTEESTVVGTNFGGVLIKLDANNHLTTGLAIPTKYLTKVEDEPKFKVGDKVVVNYSTGDMIGRIQEVLYDGYYDVDYGGGCTGHHIFKSRLVPYTEPTELVQPKEQTEGTSPNVNHSDIDIDTIVARGYIPDPNSFFKRDWDAYTVDLAKELAIAYAKRGKSPLDAVAAAKEIAKRLKQK